MSNRTSLSPAPGGRIHVLEVLGNAIVGGMENYVLHLVKRLPRERFMFTVLCPFEGALTEKLRALDVEVAVTPMPNNPPWCSIQVACGLVRTSAIDVLHAHLDNAHLLAGLAGKLTGKPVLATIHGRQLAIIDAEIQRTAGTHLGVVCRQTYYHAVGMGLNAGQLSYTPNGVDIDLFRPRERAPDGLRAEFGIPPEAPVVGFVGRLVWEKGPEVFLNAVLLLRHLVPDAHFIMVGDGELQYRVNTFVERYGMQDRLHQAGLRTDMAAIYSQFDVLACTSHSEAMPFSIMEAMASGLPVVATEVGGIPDLIEQGRTGWLIRHEDAEGIAKMTAQLLRDPAQRQAMGERARQRAVQHFSLGGSVERVGQLLARLAPTRNEQRRIGAVSSE